MIACHYCGHEVEAHSRNTWRRVSGWERKASAAARRSGSDIVLREPGDEFACNACIVLLKDGIAPGQESLL